MIAHIGQRERLILVIFACGLAFGITYLAVRSTLASHYASMGTIDGLERAVRLEPKNADYWYLLGRALHPELQRRDDRGAIRALYTAVSLNPRSASTWIEIASIYEGQGAFDAAGQAFRQAQSLYPASAEVHWQYGNFLLRRRELRSAALEIREAVQADPKLALAAHSRPACGMKFWRSCRLRQRTIPWTLSSLTGGLRQISPTEG